MLKESAKFLALPLIVTAKMWKRDYHAAAQRTQILTDAVKHGLAVDTRKDTFNDAKRDAANELDMDDQEFSEHQMLLERVWQRRCRVFYGLAAFGLVYSVYLIVFAQRYLPGAQTMIWTMLLLMIGLQSAMRYWQIHTQRIVPFLQWLRAGKLWC